MQGVVSFSSFDNLGMPKIRPRGTVDEKPQEETPVVDEEVMPVRDLACMLGALALAEPTAVLMLMLVCLLQVLPVPELITMSPFDLLIEQTAEIGLFMREVLLQHFEYVVRLPRPELFTEAFTKNYFAR